MISIFRPPPKLRTEILLSVRPPTESVPTWVGCSRMSGGSRVVYCGFQSTALAVVRLFTTVSGDDGRAEREARLEEEFAVVKMESVFHLRRRGKMRLINTRQGRVRLFLKCCFALQIGADVHVSCWSIGRLRWSRSRFGPPRCATELGFDCIIDVAAFTCNTCC